MELFGKYWGCHQIPDRSYFLFGYQLPVCVRCEGLIIGEIISIILLLMGFKIKFYICFVMLIPMVLDGLIQYKTLYKSNNIKRIITGFLFGIGFVYTIHNIIRLIRSIL